MIKHTKGPWTIKRESMLDWHILCKSNIPGHPGMVNYLTWDDLADLYKQRTGGIARIKPMQTIYNWAIKQKDIQETKDGLRIIRRDK